MWIFSGMKRLFDLVLVLISTAILALPLVIIAMTIKITSKDSVLYWSDRVGKNNEIFRMPKFRSMKGDTPEIATHLLRNPQELLTPIGDFLRKSSLDELPQLWSILTGEMSFVGPRPVLFNHDNLNVLRTKAGVYEMTPGLTGWAQINGRDELSDERKVELDVEYMQKKSFVFDLKIIWLTFIKVLNRDGISH